METRYGFSKEIFYIIIDVFKKYSDVIEKVLLFGSRARGDFKRTSDIDIAIKFNVKIGKNSPTSKVVR